MTDYSFGYETNDGHHGLGTSEAAPPVAFTVRRHDAENPLTCEEIVYRPERTCHRVVEVPAERGCGQPALRAVCSECGDMLGVTAAFCKRCGAKVVG